MSHSLKRGLETYGHAVVKELEQLHDCRTIHPRFAAELSNAEKRQAPAYFMFIKKNDVLRSRDGYVATATNKGCYKTKEDTSSPMVWTELLLLLYCFVDAKERRQVTTCDVPGAFMQFDIDEVIQSRLEGALAELLTKVDPELYTKYLVMEKKG